MCVQALLLAPSLDLRSQKPFVITITPLGNLLSSRDLRGIDRSVFPAAEEETESRLGPLARADEDVSHLARVDELPGADKLCGRADDLLHAVLGQGQLCYAGVPAVDGPLGLAFMRGG